MDVRHHLPATRETVRIGVIDHRHSAVLTVGSGETVSIETWSAWGNAVRPGMTITDVLAAVAASGGAGPHDLTGPVAIRGARPGDALRVDVLGLELRPHVFNINLPGHLGIGLLAEDFAAGEVRHYELEPGAATVELAPGVRVPVTPFPGFLGVAPEEPGPHSSNPPGRHGGNLDLTDLGPGSTLYLPVLVDGGLFYTGDMHAAQGNGEVNLTALEASATGITLRFTVIPGAGPRLPRAETPTHLITLGFGATLEEAARDACREMVALLSANLGIGENACYAICSMAMDLNITQVVNGNVGVHASFPKSVLSTSRPDVLADTTSPG